MTMTVGRIALLCSGFLLLAMALTGLAHPTAPMPWHRMWMIVCAVPVYAALGLVATVATPAAVVLNRYGVQRHIKPERLFRLEVRRLGPTGRMLCCAYEQRNRVRRFAYAIPESQPQEPLETAIAWLLQERDLRVSSAVA